MSKAMSRWGIHPRAIIGVLALLGGTVIWVLAFTGGLSTIFGSSTKVVHADFQSIEDIVPNDPVRIDGVQVGTVAGESLDPGGRGATLTMDIDTSDPIYANAKASILWRTVLGANDAVALYPGTRSAGLLGARTIAQSHDTNQVELDQITQAVHGGAQSGMRTMLQQLAPALSAHPALALDFRTLARIAPEATIGIGAVRGENQDTDLRALVRDAGQAAQAMSVGTGAATTRQFVSSAATTLNAVSANPADLQNTITGLDSVLPLLTQTSQRVTYTTSLLNPLIAKLTPEVPQVTPTLRALRPTVTDAHKLLSDATPLLHKLGPTVDSLAATARVGVPLIDNVAPSLERIKNQVLPGLAEKTAETQHPAYDMLDSTLAGFGNWAGFFDQDGNVADFVVGLEDIQAPQLLPCSLDFSGEDFLVCSSLSDALQEFFTGGTSLLQSLSRRPGAASLYAPLLARAQKIQTQFAQVRSSITSKFPALAKFLYDSHRGAG
jgi:ABC-type transporter Mla subunit MlaD